MRFQKVHMQRRKVTVHFGAVRLVVPCPNEEMTVAELAELTVQRYKKATGKPDADVRIVHLECLRDGGILDPDDRVADVFDESRDQILAIYDEQSPNGSGLPAYQVLSPIPTSSTSSFNSSAVGGPLTSSPLPRSGGVRPVRPTSVHAAVPPPLYTSAISSSSSMDFPNQSRNAVPATYGRSPMIGRIKDSVVEVKNFDRIPDNGIRVTTPSDGASSSSPPIRSSMRSETSTPSRTHRVTLSPEVEKRLTDSERQSSGRFARNSARKSRISEAFYEAQDRLEDSRQPAVTTAPSQPSVSQRVPLHFLEDAPNETIITFLDEKKGPMGLEINGIYDQPTSKSSSAHLTCLEIVKIDTDGRVGRDGRLKTTDRIVAIDGRPVYQMSILRARAYLSDLQEKAAPTLTIDRNIATFNEDDIGVNERNTTASSSQRKPVQSALQQANTRAIGQTITVNLTKSSAGFGFTVTGRETAAGERLFYIGTVKPSGVALGHLRAGDRLLEVNGEGTADMTQPEVVERLKRAAVGDTVAFLVSRVGADEDKENRAEEAVTGPGKDEKDGAEPPAAPVVPLRELPPRENNYSPKPPDFEEQEYVIPLNSTGSAGLGIRLKARVTIRSDKSRQDCGIFVKALLHGGAADKDGRLRVDDRIVAIGGERLDGDSNQVASSKISGCFKALGTSSNSVRIGIHRKSGIFAETSLLLDHHHESAYSSSAIATPSPISLRFSQSSEGRRSSVTSDVTRADDLEAASDAFDREAPTRKSMSEKRGMRTSNDPNHIRLFQDIKHQRQTSAPPMSASPMTSSFHGQSTRSASQRAAARARSQSVHPRSPASSSSSQPKGAPVGGQYLTPEAAAPRRSLSMESINTQTKSQGGKDYETPHPFPPGSEVYIQKREASTSSKDRQRRKSVGSAVKSWFGFSREMSPERSERIRQEASRMEEEDRRRVQEHYDRLRQKEAATNRNLSAVSAPRGSPYYQDYAAPPPSQLPSPERPLILANSRFYASQRASVRTTTTTTSSTATRPIATPTSTTTTAPSLVVPTRRPITTLFPVENTCHHSRCNSSSHSMGMNDRCREGQPPTTTTCSTPGSLTAVEAPWEQRPLSRPLTGLQQDGRKSSDRSTEDALGHELRRTSFRKQQSLPNSTPIAFPTTRFAFASPSHFTGSTGSAAERLSMRARKQRRREVQSALIETSSSSSPLPVPRVSRTENPPTPLARTVTAITEPAPDYCSVWNHWNERTGCSLPARRPRPPRPRLNHTLYEAVTDC